MIKKVLILLVVLFTLFGNIYAYEVEQFTKYNSQVKILEDNKLEVDKDISIRNVHDSGIIPGQVEFKIYAGEDSGLNILNYSATNRYGADIKSKLVNTNSFSSIILDIYQPILPGFEYQINLNYILEYESSGIFFKRVELPLKENTRVPILDGEVIIEVPEGRSFTYLSYEDGVNIESNKLVITLDENTPDIMTFEYSFIPLKLGSIPGSLIFWVIVNIILISILVIEIRRGIKKHKK